MSMIFGVHLKPVVQRLEGKADISLVLDDQAKYWPANLDSLIPIGSYFWGPFARSMPNPTSVTLDESTDFGPLATIAEVFCKVHARMVCAGESCEQQQGESSTQGAKAVVDARCALRQELHQVPFLTPPSCCPHNYCTFFLLWYLGR